MSMKQIKKAVRKSKDDFAVGTIVAWTASEKYKYAAIKSPVGWYTTASDRAAAFGFVNKVLDFDEVLEILARGETAEVRVIGLDDGTRV